MSFPRRIHGLSSQTWINDYVSMFKIININKDIERKGDERVSQYWLEIPIDVKNIHELKKWFKKFFKIKSPFELTVGEAKGYFLHDGFPADFNKHLTIYIVPTTHVNGNVAIADDLSNIVKGVSSMEVDDGGIISGQDIVLEDENFKKEHEFETSTPKEMICKNINELQKTKSVNADAIEISPSSVSEIQYESPMSRNDFQIYTDCDPEITRISGTPSTEVQSPHQDEEEDQTTTTNSSSSQYQGEEESLAVTKTEETEEIVATLHETVHNDSWMTFTSNESSGEEQMENNIVIQDHQMEDEDEIKLTESNPVVGEEENEEEEQGSKIDDITDFSQHSVGNNSPMILQKRVAEAPENGLKDKKSKSDPPTPTSPLEKDRFVRCFSEPPMKNKVRRDSFIPSLSLAKPVVDLQKLVSIAGDGWFNPIKSISEIQIYSWIKFSLPTETGKSKGPKNYQVQNVDVEHGTFTASPFHEERMTNPLSADLIKFNFNEILNPLIHVSPFPKEEDEEEKEEDNNNEESF